MISGTLHVLRVGCRWREVPIEYGPAKTVYNRYHRWARRRIWHGIFEKMVAKGPVPWELSLDSTHIKAHRSAQGWTQAIGTSRGGRTSKIHCLADDRGRPLAFGLTPGNVADIKMAIPLLEVARPTKRLLADKAYDADSLRGWLARRKIKAVIPSSAARKTPYPLDRKAYRRRNVIERLFCRLKNWRRIPTRYDRLATNYLAAIALVSAIIVWI